jgi:hypothetical protein
MNPFALRALVLAMDALLPLSSVGRDHPHTWASQARRRCLLLVILTALAPMFEPLFEELFAAMR